MNQTPGLELTLSDRSPLWEPFTDCLFEKKDGVWTKSANMVFPRDVMTVTITPPGKAAVGVTYQFDTEIRVEYDYRFMTMTSMWYNREERGELYHEDKMRRLGFGK